MRAPAGCGGRLSLEREVLGERVEAHRLGEQEALSKLAPELSQRVDLRRQFDSLRNDVELEVVAEPDDRRREAGVLMLGRKKRAVHLQDVDRETAEIAQRRIA